MLLPPPKKNAIFIPSQHSILHHAISAPAEWSGRDASSFRVLFSRLLFASSFRVLYFFDTSLFAFDTGLKLSRCASADGGLLGLQRALPVRGVRTDGGGVDLAHEELRIL